MTVQSIALGVFLGMIAYRVANLAIAAIAHAFVLFLADRWPATWSGFADSLARRRV
ncbi:MULTISPECIES: hypothetical protein [Xanthomonas translucens group]|jgi:hypothetical protein|uniref:hypothetical protein n=1 Tax=Xanthomonas translucens group TaxID=3390202 RepID=UPI000B2521D1|nr:hypothetical protein [Xanthomonas translucens]QSQ40413.1 hypothetical protein ISN33_12085 [Xanthomonas translucens pv. translucens]QSQ48390.1 hypothetical protein ISN35_15350 [Xanthomonas translucens pv. undulosa]UKE45599.1 hypothetical protein KHA79_10295 [Xanthomonas translucens pv. cerealis]